MRVPAIYLRFLSLEASDQIDEQFSGFYQHRRNPEQELHVIWADAVSAGDAIAKMSEYIDSSKLFVMFHHSEHMGILELESRILFRKAVQIILTSKGTIWFFPEAFEDGARLDFYEKVPTGVTFECIAWGAYRNALESAMKDIGDVGVVRKWSGSTDRLWN